MLSFAKKTFTATVLEQKMEKRYQVFVSSTYADLMDERQAIIQMLMEMDCIPAGMELFPAIDDEQWQFIKTVIDDCDYYLLVIGGRYGSLSAEGISFTEMEFDYAQSKGLKIIALLHGAPADIPVGKTDKDPGLQGKLNAFIEKAKSARLVKFWTDPRQLPGLVSVSLTQTIKRHPAVGWVRADAVASNDLLNEINELRKKNQQLEMALRERQADNGVDLSKLKLAGLDDRVNFKVNYIRAFGLARQTSEIPVTWGEAFAAISPYISEPNSEKKAEEKFTNFLLQKINIVTTYSQEVDEQQFQTLKIQFQALGLIVVEPTKSGMSNWRITDNGRQKMFSYRVVQRADPN